MRDLILPLTGWMLFLLSSGGFLLSSYKSGDVAALAGSILFFLGCIVFLVPFGKLIRGN